MSQLITFRKGLESGRLLITPAVAEPIFTTDQHKLYIGDGTTAGGLLVNSTLGDDLNPTLGANLNLNSKNIVVPIGTTSSITGYKNLATLTSGSNATQTQVQLGDIAYSWSNLNVSLGTQVTHLEIGDAIPIANKLEVDVTQTLTSAYTAYLVDVTELTTGSGAKNIVDLQVGAVSKFKVTSIGDVTIAGTTASTSSITGALAVAGGLGIVKDLFVGGGINTGNLASNDGLINFIKSSDGSIGGVISYDSILGGINVTGLGTGGKFKVSGLLETLGAISSTQTYLLSGTDSYDCLLINSYEGGSSTGERNLLNLQLSGTSKFKVNTLGGLTMLGILDLGDVDNYGQIRLFGGAGGAPRVTIRYNSTNSNLEFLNSTTTANYTFNRPLTSSATIAEINAIGNTALITKEYSAAAYTYTAGAGITLTGNSIAHTDTSSVASLAALTGAVVISDLDFDTYGHVTLISTRSLTPANIGAEASSNKGIANGYCPLDASTLIPAQYLPSYVDDVVEGYYKVADGLFYTTSGYVTLIAGATGKIYVDLTTNKTYRWSGTVFVYITSGAVGSVFGRIGLVVAASGDYSAIQITNTPSGSIAAVTVQAAINELATEKLDLAGGTMTGLLLLSADPTLSTHAANKNYVDTHTIDGGTF